MSGKNMNYYLMDGTPNGRIKCTLANWTGVAYKIPRVKLVDCKSIDYLKQSGVYFLFSKGDNDRPLVYVGQAGTRKNGEGILNRLKEHQASPKQGLEDWYEAVAFTTSNNSFGATEISWLENRFFTLSTDINRYTAKNGNEPNVGNVTEEKESELEEFVDYAKIVIVMGVLGHMVFESLTDNPAKGQATAQTIENDTTFHLQRKTMSAEATGKRTNDGFVVLKGSGVCPKVSDNVPDGIKRLRENHANKIGDGNKLTEDVLFTSPSTASSFVVGTVSNGRVDWKTADGKTLKEIETSEANEL